MSFETNNPIWIISFIAENNGFSEVPAPSGMEFYSSQHAELEAGNKIGLSVRLNYN